MVEDLFRAARRGAMSAEPGLAVAGADASSRGWMTLPDTPEDAENESAAGSPLGRPTVGAYEPPAPRLHEPSPVAEPVGTPPAVRPGRRGPARPQGVAAAVTDPPSEGWRRRVRWLTGGLIAPGPSAAQRRLRAARAVVRSALDRPLTIVFANPDATMGRTRTPMRVAATFGVLRGGSVVAWALDGPGMPGVPATQEPALGTVSDLVTALPRFDRVEATRSELAAFLRPQPSGVDVLPASGRPVFGPAEFTGVHRVLRRFYPVVCVVAGPATPVAAWSAAADVLVVCCMATQASVDAGRQLLAQLRSCGQDALVAGAVGVMSAVDRKTSATAGRMLCEQLRAELRTAVAIAYDRRQRAEERLVHRRSAAPVSPEWTFVCASVVDSFVNAEVK